ncbi:Glucoamylase GH15 family [Pseudomonas syringae pv. actinidiae]|uniref:Glucoamylase GH15 family n=1 Tax=Pseudomonas syringae pv. actinidiae TaxID=103796 RepID=A0A2V0QM45_PSESF|nr:Glucoamylase GH15 family [Pseudomonas syringae pv. actinidiae]
MPVFNMNAAFFQVGSKNPFLLRRCFIHRHQTIDRAKAGRQVLDRWSAYSAKRRAAGVDELLSGLSCLVGLIPTLELLNGNQSDE